MTFKDAGPVLLHVLTGVAVFVLLARTPRCGGDECLRTLFLVVVAVVWSAALPLVVVLARRRGAFYALGWTLPLAWAPIAWTVTLGLFLAARSLGGA